MDDRPWITFESLAGGDILTQNGQIIDHRANAKNSNPSFITIIGRKLKTTLLEQFLGTVSIPVHQQVYLRVLSKRRSGQTPVVVVDCGVSRGQHTVDQPSENSISWEIPAQKNITAAFTSRILSPFSSVIVYFVSDLGGLRSVAEWLAHQATSPPAFDLPVLPRILLVMDTTSDSFDESIAANRAISQLLVAMQDMRQYNDQVHAQSDVYRHFREISVLGLKSAMPLGALGRIFKKRVLALSDLSMRERFEAGVQFSLSHFQALSKLAIDHFSQGKEKVHFAKISRPRGFSIELFPHCLEDLFDQLPSQSWLWHVSAPLIASALLLSCYPPSAHNFAPEFLFFNMFSSSCESAVSQYTADVDIQRKFMISILAEFNQLYTEYRSSLLPAAEIHRKTLQRLQPHMAHFKSHRTCFCCFMRMPEKAMICGHALCDPCIKIFGRRSCSEKNTFELSECPLCGVSYSNSIFRFVPPTAGIRVLTLDGGGVRGVIPLKFLEHIQTTLRKLCCPVRDYFDFVCGTSTGGLIAIGMFLLQWDISESLERFEQVAKRTFSKRKDGGTLLSKALELLVAYIDDGQYSLSAIQEAFRVTFDSEIKMFNPLRNDTKVAVTTTTTNGSLPRLFTNYNGGKRPSELGYDVIRAEQPHNDISVSEAACCTSAAPWFFKPRDVLSLGTFQDGGLHHNNPADIARWEAAFLWPTRDPVDFALSLGTGTTSTKGPASKTMERFYRRLYNSWLRSLDGEEAWKRFKNTVPAEHRDRLHRLNVRFKGPEPRLDDASSIPELKSQVPEAICSMENDIRAVIDTMMATIFYFELDGPPVFEDGQYRAVGFVFCRLDLPAKGRKYLYLQLLETSSWFLVQGQPIVCVESVPKSLPPFKRRIRFAVDTLTDIVAISIRGITSIPKLISGCPTTLQGLINHQQLDSPFGTVDHVGPEKPLPSIPCKRVLERSKEGSRKRHQSWI